MGRLQMSRQDKVDQIQGGHNREGRHRPRRALA
jgi:hypothetical protein